MKANHYQINFGRDNEKRAFRPLNTLPLQNGQPFVDSSIYDKVFQGEIDVVNLEDLCAVIEKAPPEGHRGRSVAVSDVFEIVGGGNVEPGFYFYDTDGFKRISSFDPEQAKPLKDTIRVVFCEPMKYARVADIDASLKGLQAAVGGGHIEAISPFDEPVCLVCNDEGKIKRMTLNRSLKHKGEILDIIAGPFFICGCSAGYFSDLTEKQQDTYLKQFYNPELFFVFNDEILSMPYSPSETTTDKPNT